MKISKIISITFFFLFLSLSSARAYVIDGNVSDWGINLADPNSKYLGYLNTHTPTGSGVHYVTEDNAAYNTGSVNVGPGWTSGNIYDAEAMYMTNDATNLYIAIITGVSKTELTYPAGDIFIDTGHYQNPLSNPSYNPSRYGFGVDIATSKLYDVHSWRNVSLPSFAISDPWKIGTNKTYLGNVPFAYSNVQNTHYVLETMIPLNLLGLDSSSANDIWLHWTMKCGNDYLNLRTTTTAFPPPPTNPIPEPASFSLLVSGLFMGFLRRKSEKIMRAKT